MPSTHLVASVTLECSFAILDEEGSPNKVLFGVWTRSEAYKMYDKVSTGIKMAKLRQESWKSWRLCRQISHDVVGVA